MNKHIITCECNYCEHVKHCVLVHDELVESLELAIYTIKAINVTNKNGLLSTTDRLKILEQALLKAKAK